MSTWNKQTLRTRVLQHLGVLGAGQDATAEDAQVVDEAIDASHQELRTNKLANFETSAIPEYAQHALRDYVAGQLSNTFGLSPQRRAELAQGVELAKIKLRQQTHTEYPVYTKATYF